MRNSERRDKFVKLAERRTQMALDAIRKIGNLSNRCRYEYDAKDVAKIVQVLQEAVSRVEKQLSSRDGDPGKFRL